MSRPCAPWSLVGCVGLLVAAGCDETQFDLRVEALIDASNGRPNIVFVSSERFVPILLTKSEADAHCNRLAAAALLGGTYSAWFARSGEAHSTLQDSRGWVRVDGRHVADTYDLLLQKGGFGPVELDEFGRSVGNVLVSTGTQWRGEPALGADGNCDWFTMDDGTIHAGSAQQQELDMFFGSFLPCNEPAPVYCFEYGNNVQVVEGL